MRICDDRYSRDRLRLDLALRFIRHEARTQTIRAWTGLTDDRIRKLYRSYFDQSAGAALPRPRGRSPGRASCFLRNPRLKQEAALLASLCLLLGALSARRVPRPGASPADASLLGPPSPGASLSGAAPPGGLTAGRPMPAAPPAALPSPGLPLAGAPFTGASLPGPAPSVAQGIALCLTYEAYRALVPAARFTFEHLVYLATALQRGEELRLASCAGCGALLVVERMALHEARCPHCLDPQERAPALLRPARGAPSR